MKKTEYTAGLSLTERCNLKCKHCYIGQRDLWKDFNYKIKEMSYDQIKAIVPNLIKANVKRINLGGGETPLHKDFIKIVEELYSAGMKISLTTNGTTYPIYKNHLHLFNDIGVSIDFPDERHSEFRQNVRAYSLAINTLNKLVENNIKTEMVTCVMSTNHKELPKIYRLAKNIGVNMWRLNRFHSSKNDKKRFEKKEGIESQLCYINESLSCSYEQMREAFEFLKSVTPKEQNYIIPDPLFRTYVGGNSLTKGSPCGKMAFRIKTNGNITPNVFTDDCAGNIFNNDLENVLKNDTFKKYLNNKPKGKCNSCVNYDSCRGGDLTDSYLINGDINLPDPYCFLDTDKKSNIKIVSMDRSKFVHESYLGTIYIPIKK